jgi:membrane associated rhomboid family serine protease
MIPLCDLVPARTTPAATLGLGAALAAFAPGWLAALLTAAAWWIFAPTVEDRLGRARLAVLVAVTGLAAWVATRPFAGHTPVSLAGIAGATAGVVAAYLALYPRGRVLGVTPVVIGFEFVDVPSWLYAGIWVTAMPLAADAPFMALPVMLGTGAATGALAARLLRLPDRMRVEWWDALGEIRDKGRSASDQGKGTGRRG